MKSIIKPICVQVHQILNEQIYHGESGQHFNK
jgi:hypothetical protein